MDDPRFFTLRYTGSAPIKSITFNGDTANPTGLQGGGIVFDPRPFTGSESFLNSGFPFTIGATAGGLQAADVSASFTRSNAPREPGTFRTMTLSFAGGGLRSGQVLQFGIDRDERFSGYGGSAQGNGADILADGVVHPSGDVIHSGLTFTATRANGTTFTGQLHNRVGAGYTKVDGFGVINAQAAVG